GRAAPVPADDGPQPCPAGPGVRRPLGLPRLPAQLPRRTARTALDAGRGLLAHAVGRAEGRIRVGPEEGGPGPERVPRPVRHWTVNVPTIRCPVRSAVATDQVCDTIRKELPCQ